MSKYILMTANTQSEWDSVDFALLPYDAKLFKSFLKAKTKLDKLKGTADQFSLYVDDVDFFTDREELPEDCQPIEEETPILIELTDEQVENLSRPEQVIKHGERKYSQWEVQFTATGKHTGEEYWCGIGWETVEKLAKGKLEPVNA